MSKKCADCIYYENDVCYRKGTRVSFNNNICDCFVVKLIDRKGLRMNLMK